MEAIELTAIYSANKLAKGQAFQTGERATHSLDYCFNHNRQCKVTKSSGRSKTYACPQGWMSVGDWFDEERASG